MKKLLVVLLLPGCLLADIQTLGYWKKLQGTILLNLVERVNFEITGGTLKDCAVDVMEKLVVSKCALEGASLRVFNREGKLSSEASLEKLFLFESVLSGGRIVNSWTWNGVWRDQGLKSNLSVHLSQNGNEQPLVGNIGLTRYSDTVNSAEATGEK